MNKRLPQAVHREASLSDSQGPNVQNVRVQRPTSQAWPELASVAKSMSPAKILVRDDDPTFHFTRSHAGLAAIRRLDQTPHKAHQRTWIIPIAHHCYNERSKRHPDGSCLHDRNNPTDQLLDRVSCQIIPTTARP